MRIKGYEGKKVLRVRQNGTPFLTVERVLINSFSKGKCQGSIQEQEQEQQHMNLSSFLIWELDIPVSPMMMYLKR